MTNETGRREGARLAELWDNLVADTAPPGGICDLRTSLCVAEVDRRQRAELFLASSVPNLELDSRPLDANRELAEICPNRRLLVLPQNG
jgi:hypothetical protein